MHKKLLTVGLLCSFIDRITISGSTVLTPNNSYGLKNLNNSKMLDDPNSSPANGTGLIQYSSHGSMNQHWRWELRSDQSCQRQTC